LRESALRKFNVNQNEATRSSPEDLYSLFIVALVNAKDDSELVSLLTVDCSSDNVCI
jgi:hypothetical protein